VAFVHEEPETEAIPGELPETEPADIWIGDSTESASALSAIPASGVAAEGPSTLAEAERLVQELESQPRDVRWGRTPAAAGMSAGSDREFSGALIDPASAVADPEEVIYRETRKTQGRRRSKRNKRRLSRSLIRWTIAAVALAVVAAGGYAGYRWLRPRFATPEAAFSMAQSLARQDRFGEAANAFADFARLHAQHPARAEAQFEAAHCLLLAPTGSFDEETKNRTEALRLFETFVTDNPAHAKAARATTLIGQVHFLLGNHEKAIETLRDPGLRMRDPESALPSLRTLARAHTQLGDYTTAESLYLQAASLAGNVSADVDYVELGDLYELQANRAATEEERQRLGKAAVEYWTKATRIPGIDPANRTKIQAKRDWFLGHGGGPGSVPEPLDAATPASEGSPAASATTAPALSQEPAMSSGGVAPPGAASASTAGGTEDTIAGPSPDMEAQFLGNGAARVPPLPQQSAGAQ